MKNFQFSIFNFQFALILFGVSFLPISLEATSVEVWIDTQGEIINALEATVHIPQGIKIDKIYDGNSAVLFWIEPPFYDFESSHITFSGITPGGFIGERIILSVSGDFAETDISGFYFSNIRALRDDGEGTSIPTALYIKQTEISDDTFPPEDFQPLIGRNNDIFGGDYFLVFTTQDKGVGVDHYEVKEGYFGDYIEAKSPYLLAHQRLNKKIFVKALDKLGNERVVTLGARDPDKWYWYLLLAIILTIAIFSPFKKLWLKKSKSGK